MRNIDRDVNYPEKKYLMVEQGIEGMANWFAESKYTSCFCQNESTALSVITELLCHDFSFLFLWAIFHEIEILSFSTNHIVYYIAIVFGCGWFANMKESMAVKLLYHKESCQ